MLMGHESAAQDAAADRVALGGGTVVFFRPQGTHAAMEPGSVMVGAVMMAADCACGRAGLWPLPVPAPCRARSAAQPSTDTRSCALVCGRACRWRHIVATSCGTCATSSWRCKAASQILSRSWRNHRLLSHHVVSFVIFSSYGTHSCVTCLLRLHAIMLHCSRFFYFPATTGYGGACNCVDALLTMRSSAVPLVLQTASALQIAALQDEKVRQLSTARPRAQPFVLNLCPPEIMHSYISLSFYCSVTWCIGDP